MERRESSLERSIAINYQQIIALLQLVILNNPTAPVANSQEFLQYSGLIPLAIRAWENERGVLWKELVTPYTIPTVLVAGAPSANTITLPSNFKFMYDGIVTLTYTTGSQRTFKVKMLEDQQFNPYNMTQEFYISGNPSAGYKIYPGWTINATDPEVGGSIFLRYYKTATVPTTDSSGNINQLTAVPEMSDPNFIVWTVANQIQGGNYNTNMQADAGNKAAYVMSQMRMANEMGAEYQDDYDKDVDYLLRHVGNKRQQTFYPRSYFS